MEAPGNDDVLHVWRASGSLPSFSRAFDKFTQSHDADDSTATPDAQFFVPSYLEGYTYMQMLQEVHKAKLRAQKDSKRSTDNGAAGSVTPFAQSPLPPGAHRGLAHNVVERTPASDDDTTLAPLPTKWNKYDVWTGIDFQSDDLSVKYVAPKNHHDHEASAVRADHYMPPQCGLYYFEVHILQGKRDECVPVRRRQRGRS